ncbi:hypothetical protein FACS1894199_10100 [Bacteroidia bacterium]|nr:hypothetical protein FACS1894199_10100 [Bacteroidia bacterium]
MIYKNIVYWCDKRGRIYGLDEKGKLHFDYNFSTAVEATPAICDGVLYIGRIDGFMTALSLSEKDTLWNFETMGQISASPNIGQFQGKSALVFGSYDNYLYCLDIETGKLLSRFESGYYINGAVALWEEYFVFGGCDAWFRVINGATGIATDSILLESYIPASPAIGQGTDVHNKGNERSLPCYVADHSGNVYELLLKGGKIDKCDKMLKKVDDNGTFVSVPAVSKETLFILSDDRNLYAINRKDGTIRWKYLQKGASGESSPLVCGDKVVSCSKNGFISVLSAQSGDLLWEYDAGEQITASPAVIEGKFYVLTAKGTMFCFGSEY